MSLRRTRGYDVCDYDGVALSYNVAGQYQTTQGQIIPGPTAGGAWWIFNTLFGQADYVDVFDQQQTFIVGFHFQFANQGGQTATPVTEFLQIGNAAGSFLSLRNNADFTISVITGANNQQGAAVELCRSAAPLILGTWYYFEFSVTVGAGGSYAFHINGDSIPAAQPGPIEMSDPNINILPLNGTTLPDRITQHFENFGSEGFAYDNLYVCDGTGLAPWNTFLGPCAVTTVLPIADQLNTGWTPSTAGDLFPMVNDDSGTHPDGDGTFITPPDLALSATWQMGSVPCFGLIYGVTLNMCARPTGGSPQLGALYQPGSTPALVPPEVTLVDTGSNLGQGEAEVFGYATYQVVTTADPISGFPWLAGNINAAFFGVGSDNFVTTENVTQFYLEVLTSLNPNLPFTCGGPGSYSYGK